VGEFGSLDREREKIRRMIEQISVRVFCRELPEEEVAAVLRRRNGKSMI